MAAMAGLADDFLKTAEHWLKRAEEARAQAEQMHDALPRDALLSIAESYEQLAEYAETRGLRKPRG